MKKLSQIPCLALNLPCVLSCASSCVISFYASFSFHLKVTDYIIRKQYLFFFLIHTFRRITTDTTATTITTFVIRRIMSFLSLFYIFIYLWIIYISTDCMFYSMVLCSIERNKVRNVVFIRMFSFQAYFTTIVFISSFKRTWMSMFMSTGWSTFTSVWIRWAISGSWFLYKKLSLSNYYTQESYFFYRPFFELVTKKYFFLKKNLTFHENGREDNYTYTTNTLYMHS